MLIKHNVAPCKQSKEGKREFCSNLKPHSCDGLCQWENWINLIILIWYISADLLSNIRIDASKGGVRGKSTLDHTLNITPSAGCSVYSFKYIALSALFADVTAGCPISNQRQNLSCDINDWGVATSAICSETNRHHHGQELKQWMVDAGWWLRLFPSSVGVPVISWLPL